MWSGEAVMIVFFAIFFILILIYLIMIIDAHRENNSQKIYCVFDYSKPIAERKIASNVSIEKASRLYWKNPETRKIYIEL